MPSELLTHEEIDRQVEQAMGAPTNSAMESFQNFLTNHGKAPITQPNMPRLPTEQIKKLPLRVQ